MWDGGSRLSRVLAWIGAAPSTQALASLQAPPVLSRQPLLVLRSSVIPGHERGNRQLLMTGPWQDTEHTGPLGPILGDHAWVALSAR